MVTIRKSKYNTVDNTCTISICSIVHHQHFIKCSNFWWYFVEAYSFSVFNFFFLYCVMFFLRKLSKFDVKLAIEIYEWCLAVISEGFPSEFLKCSFHFWSLSSWQAALSFALEVLFFPLSLFTLCDVIRDCLSFIEFLILSMWPSM